MNLLSKKLLTYYNKELTYLRHYGALFAKRFPKIAKQLGMVGGASEDPHVERLVEAFAFLTAKLHQQIDEDMPELHNAIMENIAPQFLRMTPAVSIIKVAVNPNLSGRTKTIHLQRGAKLQSREIEGVICRFKTIYDLDILPVELTAVTLQRSYYDEQLSLELKFSLWPNATINAEKIRIYLPNRTVVSHYLYQTLLCQVKAIKFHQHQQTLSLDKKAIKAIGFAEYETIMDHDSDIEPIHHLIRDYIDFPERFFFIDIPLPSEINFSNGREFSLAFLLEKSDVTEWLEEEQNNIDDGSVLLHCTPIANYFSHQSEPIFLSEEKNEYLVSVDIRQPFSYDIYKIHQVSLIKKENNQLIKEKIAPLLGIEHHDTAPEQLYWQTKWHQFDIEEKSAKQLFISFANLSSRPLWESETFATAELLCTNGYLPSYLKSGHPEGDFELEQALPDAKIIGVMKPKIAKKVSSATLPDWRFVSHLSLQKKLFSGKQGVKLLQETLELYNLNQEFIFSQLVNLMSDLETKTINSRLNMADPHSFAKGLAVTLTFQKEVLIVHGFYLFCQIIDNFIGLYAPINSFVCTHIYVDGQDMPYQIGPKRLGRHVWL